MTIHPSFQWKGRHDGDGTAHLRFHHLVGQSPTATYTLIGFASDEGVRRNHGRIGASLAPDAIRTQFSNLPVHQSISISDWGTIYCEDAALEAAQEQLATAVDACLQQGSKPVVLGGGHEVAFGSFSGLFRHVLNQDLNKKLASLTSMLTLICVKPLKSHQVRLLRCRNAICTTWSRFSLFMLRRCQTFKYSSLI